jgi:hypothetical protein
MHNRRSRCENNRFQLSAGFSIGFSLGLPPGSNPTSLFKRPTSHRAAVRRESASVHFRGNGGDWDLPDVEMVMNLSRSSRLGSSSAVEDFILVKHFRENITDAATPGTNHLAIGLRSRDTIDHSSAAHRSDG